MFQRYFKCSAVFYAGKTVLGRIWKYQGILNRIIRHIGISATDCDGLAKLAIVFLAISFEEFKVNTLAVGAHNKTRAFREVFTGFTGNGVLGFDNRMRNLNWFLSLLSKSYLWNDNKAVVEWLEKELKEEHSVIDENVKWIRRDWVLRQVKTWVSDKVETICEGPIDASFDITSLWIEPSKVVLGKHLLGG